MAARFEVAVVVAVGVGVAVAVESPDAPLEHAGKARRVTARILYGRMMRRFTVWEHGAVLGYSDRDRDLDP